MCCLKSIKLTWQGQWSPTKNVFGLFAYIIRKTIRVQVYGDYHKYATSDNEMMARMLNPPLDKRAKVHTQSRSIQQSTR